MIQDQDRHLQYTIDYIDKLNINPYQFRIFYHYLAIGHADEPIRKTASSCKISLGKAHRTRVELINMGLLSQFGVIAKEIDRSGYVYLIRSGKYYKIGISKNPERRMQDLQTAHPLGLEMMCFAWFENAKALEKRLHKEFDHCRMEGEWFNFSEGNVSYIVNKLNG